ncbi:MAG: TraU family protein, partial [Gammaproteobacteria bacterium]|nr:TraU family protein [Gammaproteobacteria bacterium]
MIVQLRITAALLFSALASSSQGEDISTANILSRTTEASLICTQWTPVGLCFWLRCSLIACGVESSLKIGHYNPDLVVSSYNELGRNPWREIRSVLGAAQRQAATGILGRLGTVLIDSAGNRTEGSRSRRDHQNLIFRDTDVVGHPGLAVPLPGALR